ncbi:MAG: hypothetical protein IKX58_08095, partial [Clostridia bacterium]|nr:hypothetical protein [Clostridia bacterium]
ILHTASKPPSLTQGRSGACNPTCIHMKGQAFTLKSDRWGERADFIEKNQVFIGFFATSSTTAEAAVPLFVECRTSNYNLSAPLCAGEPNTLISAN